MTDYSILQISLDKIPWMEWYPCRRVRDTEFRNVSVEDDYDEKDNYGLYDGDDKLAYAHACKVLGLLSRQDDADGDGDSESYAAALYQTLLKDIRKFIMASECLVHQKNAPLVEKLLDQAAGVRLCGEIAEFVIDRYKEYKKTEEKFGDEFGIALDFPELYMKCGDQALYEQQDKKLALMFYRLTRLNWHGKKKQTETVDLYLNTLERVMDGRYTLLLWKNEDLAYRQCRESYCACRKSYVLNRDDITSYMRLAGVFADCYQRNIGERDWPADRTDEVERRDIVRVCYAMALVVQETVFVCACACLSDEPAEVRQTYRDDVLSCLKRTKQEELKSISRYIFRQTVLNMDIKYQNALIMLKCLFLVNEIKQILLAGNHGGEIAYYTSVNTLRFLLPEHGEESMGRLSIMHMSYMNDPNEGKILRCFFDEEESRNGRKQRKSVRTPYVFMKCFTSLIDNLPMWEMYGDHAKGCCILFRRQWYTKEDKKPVPLYHVCYLAKGRGGYCLREEDNPQLTEIKKLRMILGELKKAYQVLKRKRYALAVFEEILESVTYLFKDANYKQEQESRILYYFPEYSEEIRHVPGEYPRLYLRTDFTIRIKEIILGPKAERISEMIPYLQEQVEKLCRKTGDDMPDITLSEIDYR